MYSRWLVTLSSFKSISLSKQAAANTDKTPPPPLTSPARVHHLLRPADVALHLTAPVEHAVAPLDHQHLLAPVAPAAAHEVAALNPLRRVVALAAVRALDAQLGVALAKGGWWLVVDEVLQVGRLVLRVVRPQLEVVLVAPGARLSLAVDAVAADAVAQLVDLSTRW